MSLQVLLPLAPMKHPLQANLKAIFNNALNAYKNRTKIDLLQVALSLVTELQSCNSPSAILAVLQRQLQGLYHLQRSDDRWTRWLDPTVNVLLTLSGTLGDIGLAFSPAKVIFAGIGVLLLVAEDVRASQDALIDVFERIEMFLRRLDVHTGVPPTNEMMGLIIHIMADVLLILGIATNEVKQGRIRRFTKKLMGRREMEDALKKLDKLTQEEARMVAAQHLMATHTVDERVGGVGDTVEAIDKKVAGIDDQVAGVDSRMAVAVDDRVAAVDDQVAGVGERTVTVDDRVKVVDNNLMQVIADGKEAKRDQLRESTHDWLSPPDPSTNHNITCDTRHKKAATWFFEGEIYQRWKSTGSLFWVHGKPGSGKSVICSTVIQDVEAMCNAGHASICYFYFDFRDINKQRWRDLVLSLLTQLSSHSDLRCDILTRLYTDHDNGAHRPSDGALKRCLIELLELPDQRPTYLIMDAFDECSNVSGKRVLYLVKELVDLQIPNLHIYVTSRPEADIRYVLEPLASYQVSLHDQSGHRRDIREYVRSVVYSNSEPIMRRWRKEDKELVIKTLSELADGIFRWICCQLEVLRQSLPPSVRRILRELPESLDETYERILKEIKKPNKDLARRVLQCLVVSTRPLRVAELAEVLAVDFNDAEGIPRLESLWRWEDQEQALLIACSSLIAIVEAGDSESGVEAAIGDSRIVQFSHFSVKEFLTSSRFSATTGEVSDNHIELQPAHTILAQVCLGVLLRIQDNDEWYYTPDYHPLAEYAAEHWTTHARLGEVSSRLHKGMEYLFDVNKPHFKVWLTLCDIDTVPNRNATFFWFAQDDKFPAAPLYYAALCGFHDLVEHLIAKHLQDVNADGGYYLRPLVAALAGEHFQTADLLRNYGADLDVRGRYGVNPLHAAASFGNLEVVRILIECDPASINARDEDGWTPLLWASGRHNIKDGSVLRLLLDRGADINAPNRVGRTPLHRASFNGTLEVVRLLLEHGADVEVKSVVGETALQEAADRGRDEVVKLLREHGAE